MISSHEGMEARFLRGFLTGASGPPSTRGSWVGTVAAGVLPLRLSRRLLVDGLLSLVGLGRSFVVLRGEIMSHAEVVVVRSHRLVVRRLRRGGIVEEARVDPDRVLADAAQHVVEAVELGRVLVAVVHQVGLRHVVAGRRGPVTALDGAHQRQLVLEVDRILLRAAPGASSPIIQRASRLSAAE